MPSPNDHTMSVSSRLLPLPSYTTAVKAVSAPEETVRTSLVIIRSVGIGRYSGGAPLEDCIVVTVESEEVLGGVESESDEPSEYVPGVGVVANQLPLTS